MFLPILFYNILFSYHPKGREGGRINQQTNLLIVYVIMFLIQVYWQMAEKRKKDRDATDMEGGVIKYKTIWILSLCDLVFVVKLNLLYHHLTDHRLKF